MLRLPFLVFCALVPQTFEQISPAVSLCPNVFVYENSTEANRWYGIINLSSDSTLKSVVLNIGLDSKVDFLGNWVAEVTSKDNTIFNIESTDIKVESGKPAVLRFFVQYNPLNQPPSLKSIKLNGREICNVKNTVLTFDASGEPKTNKPPTLTDKGQLEPDTSIVSNNNYYASDVKCGTVVHLNPNVLATHGRPTLKGQWPWQIALYFTARNNQPSKYQCGGTLVSNTHVITAGHCVTEMDSNRVVNAEALSVHLGKHNLRTSVEGVQIRTVKQIKLHPGYNATAHAHDLAILFIDAVTFSQWVRPACLWPETEINLRYVIGRSGSVVGWGIDETGVSTEELTLVEMPIVDTDTCIRSELFTNFFLRYTSDFTYCAGNRDGVSVCNGDSGGGMVFKKQNAWYLRGLVSLSVASQNANRCDPSHYVVFTDLAKYLSWIRRNIMVHLQK